MVARPVPYASLEAVAVHDHKENANRKGCTIRLVCPEPVRAASYAETGEDVPDVERLEIYEGNTSRYR